MKFFITKMKKFHLLLDIVGVAIRRGSASCVFHGLQGKIPRAPRRSLW